MTLQVRNNRDKSRYELLVDGDLAGIADYSLTGRGAVMPHTEIDARQRGQGLGAALVKGALEDLRRSSHTVIPECWYVARYIDEHPEFADLVAGRSAPQARQARQARQAPPAEQAEQAEAG